MFASIKKRSSNEALTNLFAEHLSGRGRPVGGEPGVEVLRGLVHLGEALLLTQLGFRQQVLQLGQRRPGLTVQATPHHAGQLEQHRLKREWLNSLLLVPGMNRSRILVCEPLD